MKATFATLACLLTAGLVTAAEVVGNNTAVVISKDVVESNNGFQFLCVPVDGLDIADGATQQTIKLSTLLPPETLEDGTRVLVGNANRYVETRDGTKTWVRNVGTTTTTDGADLDLEGGTIFWLEAPKANPVSVAALLSGISTYSSEESSKPTSIVFCGQNRDREAQTWNELTAGEVTALKNDSSVAITLNQAAALSGEETRSEDQILTIQANSSEYKIYYYREGAWKSGSKIMQVVDGAVIAPGEAFYYYKASN